MTNADVLCKVMSEVTGKPEKTFRAVLAQLPPDRRGSLDQVCPDAPAMLAQSRTKEGKSAIFNWMVDGAIEAMRERQSAR